MYYESYTKEENEEIREAINLGMRPLLPCMKCGTVALCTQQTKPCGNFVCDECLETTEDKELKNYRVVRSTRGLS